jgi:flagellar biosynthesis protein
MTSHEPNAALRRLACALRYDRSRDSAPRVMAKGWGRFAERIIAEARKAGVPLREDAVLARLLAAVEIAEEIPEELFRPVAELLAAVYRAATAGRVAG